MQGGHDFPITKIIKRYFDSISNCKEIAQKIDRLYIYVNSVDNTEAKLLFKASKGKLTKKYLEINEWALPIFEVFK